MYKPKDTGIGYLLWCLGLIGLCGMHRFYAGKWITGIIWLMTGGLIFIGQLIDLFLIPGHIRVANLEAQYQADAIAGMRDRQRAAG